jgi:hypothetical protein
VVEHFHGKEGVLGSNPSRGSMVIMKKFLKLNPNIEDSKHRSKDILTRTTFSTLGAGMIWQGVMFAGSSEFPHQYGGVLLGLVGVLAVGSCAVLELNERGYGTTGRSRGARGGGGGWEPPESPNPQGPGGIPVDENWIHDVEDYLDTKELVSV